MRGQLERSASLFSYVSIEERIPAGHPLRRIRSRIRLSIASIPHSVSSTPQKTGHR
jgi:hypothetical protein